MKKTLIILSVASMAFFSLNADASSYRCKNKLVKVGDTSIEVKLKCGKPFDESYIGQVKVKGKYVNLERYTYIPSKGQFIKILEFHDGNLVSITDGPRA